MEGENSFDVDLGPDCSLQLLNGVHLVSTGEGGQTRVLLPLHRCIKLNEIDESWKMEKQKLSHAAPCSADSPWWPTLASRHTGLDAFPLALMKEGSF